MNQVLSSRRDGLLWGLTGAGALLYAALSAAVYSGYNSGMLDLGNMAQAIWNTLQGRILEFSGISDNASRLTGHVEAIYLLLVPLYALWPDPRMLLIVQAVLMALGALAVYRIAMRRLGSRGAARAFALAYLLYPTAVSAVLFDFHGDTLAMPLLLFALEALDRRAWRSYVLFLVLSLLCKFYIAAPVALLGLVLLDSERAPYPAQARLASWRLGRWRVSQVGLLTFAGAAAYGALAFLVVRPLFAPTGVTAATSTASYASYYFGVPDNLLGRLISVAAVLLPSGLLGFWAPRALLPALAIIVPAALSTGPAAAYDFRYHHYAVAVPFIISAAILGAQRRATARRARRPAGASATLVLLLTLIFHMAFNDTPLGFSFWSGLPGSGLDPSRYGRTPRDALKDRWLHEHVPAGEPVVASNFLAAHLTNRATLHLLRYPREESPEALQHNLPKARLVVVDALQDYYVRLDGGYGGGLAGEVEALALVLRDQQLGLVQEQDGLLLFQRAAAPNATLQQQVEQMASPAPPAHPTAIRFGAAIELAGYSVEQLDERRVQLVLHWRALRPFQPGERYVAVSRLEGPGGALLRYPHLPTMALLPTDSWDTGQTVVETRTIQLPAGAAAGAYRWRIAWYHPAHPLAAWSDPAALIPGSSEQLVRELLVPPQ